MSCCCSAFFIKSEEEACEMTKRGKAVLYSSVFVLAAVSMES